MQFWKTRNSKRRRSQKTSSVQYETLERRLPLTTFLVNTETDDASGIPDGLVSFTEAVTAANTNAAFGDAPAGDADGDRIHFTRDVAQVGEYPIEIIDDLLIQGGGAKNGRIEFFGRAFSFNTSERVGFGRANFRGSRSAGAALGGGAIRATGEGRIVIVDSLFSNNSAITGGAIYHENGILNVIDSRFLGNRIGSAGGSIISEGGGAIFSKSGTVKIVRTEFNGNYSVDHSDGGAIAIVDGRFDSVDSTFHSNYTGGQVPAPVRGGALLLEGESTVTIRGGEFSQNDSGGIGGAIWMSAISSLSIVDTSFVRNGSEETGGAIFNDGGSLQVRDSTFEDQYVFGRPDGVGRDGAVFQIKGGDNLIVNSTFEGNVSYGGDGGVIRLSGGSLVINESTFDSNEAKIGNGGVIYVTGAQTFVRLNNTTLENNSAEFSGGAIWMGKDTKVVLYSSSVLSNLSQGYERGDGGGGIYNDGGMLRLDSSLVDENTAREGGGVYGNGGEIRAIWSTIRNNFSYGSGGGIKMGNGNVYVNAVNFFNNRAGLDPDRVGNGGAIHLSGEGSQFINEVRLRSFSRFSYYFGSFDRNSSDSGGAIWAGPNTSLILSANSKLARNSAINGSGGAIYSEGHVQLNFVSILENTATLDGGGVYVGELGAMQLYSKTNFETNSAMRYGGGVFNGGFVVSRGTHYSDNTAGEEGDSIYTSDTGRFRG